MLLQFSCSNHKSIKDEITFSMVASKDSTNADTLRKLNNVRVVRVASIYGANGSGKSNFVDAIGFARNLIVNSLSHPPGSRLIQFPHKLSNVSDSSKYEFQFAVEDIRYVYGFSIKNGIIDDEYFYYFPNNKKIKVFERIGMKIIPGNRYKSSFTLSKEVLKENRLFLACAANYSRIAEIEKAFIFFSRDLVLYSACIDEPSNNVWYEYSIDLLEKNPEIKSAFLEMLKILGTGVIDVSARTESINLDELKKKIPEHITSFLPQMLDNTVFKNFQVKMIYNDFETDLMTEESTGIKLLFKVICPIIDILINGRVLVCDEIEAGLHESIVHQIVKLFYFLMPDKFAQLIFTTHDTSLLDLELFRRDQIWFTQLTSERATELYSLVEIKDVRKHENIAKGYIAGKYGAIPMLNKAFVENINPLRTKASWQKEI